MMASHISGNRLMNEQLDSGSLCFCGGVCDSLQRELSLDQRLPPSPSQPPRRRKPQNRLRKQTGGSRGRAHPNPRGLATPALRREVKHLPVS